MASTALESHPPRVPTWTLGDRIAKARRAAGMEQGELAAQVGASQSLVSKWERDLAEPRASVVIAIARATNVPSDWLLSGEFPLRGERQRPALRAIDGGRTTSGQRALNLQVIK